MNKKVLLLIIGLASTVVLLFSFVIKGFVSQKSARLVDKTKLENRASLLSLAGDYEKEKDYVKAREAFREFVGRFPGSKDAPRVEKDIENLNMKILFSRAMTSESFPYEIKKGDTLARIASRFNTTTELIKKSNNLRSDLILPGKNLKINKIKFNILVNKTDNTLALCNDGGEIVKMYRVSTGKNFSTPTGTFKVEEKLPSPVWYKVGAVIEPGSPEYELGTRWIGLSLAGYGIHGTKDPESIGQYVTMGCIRMKNEDVEELYAVVASGTVVEIVE